MCGTLHTTLTLHLDGNAAVRRSGSKVCEYSVFQIGC